MHNHTPENYVCPICLAIQGIKSPDTLINKSDIIYKDDEIMIFISSFFIQGNEGHVIIVPVEHYENIYGIPDNILNKIVSMAKKISLIVRENYPNCEGISLLQNNEPAGDQHAFHFHLHIFPRYAYDNLHENLRDKRIAALEEKNEYSKMLVLALQGN